MIRFVLQFCYMTVKGMSYSQTDQIPIVLPKTHVVQSYPRIENVLIYDIDYVTL